MDKKLIIGGIIALVVIVVAAFALMGGSTDNDPTHLTVAAHSNIKEPESGFNPLTGWGCGHQNYNPLVQSCLFKTDKKGEIVPDLAKDYSISSDGKKWTVHIRDDVKFSDNSTLDAEDVAFTYNEAKKVGASELDLGSLKNATVVDKNTVKFELNESDSTFVDKVAYIGIVPSDSYNNETYGANPVS